MRLIQQLLSTEGHEERRELLKEHRNVIDDQFLKLMEAIVEDLRSQKQETAAEHLSESVKDVKTILQGDHDPSTD